MLYLLCVLGGVVVGIIITAMCRKAEEADECERCRHVAAHECATVAWISA
jgi:hypothetical protein